MIHHFSISAHNPQHVAEVLAEIMKGKCVPFFPHPGSYMALSLDQHGTGIEVYPLTTTLRPGEENTQVQFENNVEPGNFTSIHAAISVTSTQEKIEEIGQREGWRVVRCNRDSLFDVIEFWLENRLMIEFLTPEMASQYLTTMYPENLAKVFGSAT